MCSSSSSPSLSSLNSPESYSYGLNIPLQMQALVTEADLEAAINQPPDPALYGGLVQDEENGDWSPRPDLCPVLEPWQEDTIAEFKRRDMISAMNAFVGCRRLYRQGNSCPDHHYVRVWAARCKMPLVCHYCGSARGRRHSLRSSSPGVYGMVMSYGGVLLTLRVNLGRLCESGMEMVGRVELAYSYIRKLRRKLDDMGYRGEYGAIIAPVIDPESPYITVQMFYQGKLLPADLRSMWTGMTPAGSSVSWKTFDCEEWEEGLNQTLMGCVPALTRLTSAQCVDYYTAFSSEHVRLIVCVGQFRGAAVEEFVHSTQEEGHGHGKDETCYCPHEGCGKALIPAPAKSAPTMLIDFHRRFLRVDFRPIELGVDRSTVYERAKAIGLVIVPGMGGERYGPN